VSAARATRERPAEGPVFPLTRDDLIECAAMVRAVKDGELDRVLIPDKPLDVLAQQIVAERLPRMDEEALFDLFAALTHTAV